MEEEYYSPWEWQPLENIPDGCNYVEIRCTDGTIRELCSCDYWWALSELGPHEMIDFRFSSNCLVD